MSEQEDAAYVDTDDLYFVHEMINDILTT